MGLYDINETQASFNHTLSQKLYDFRGMTDLFRLQTLIEKTVNVEFIIDCQPNFDNVTLSAINASARNITPVFLNLVDVSAALFLGEKIQTEKDKYRNWFINVCGYNRLHESAVSGKQKNYLTLFEENFKGHITTKNAWFPWTSDVDEYKDRQLYLSNKKMPYTINNLELFNLVMNLVRCFTDEELSNPDYF